MKILAIDKVLPGITEEQIYPHLPEEAAKVWELHSAGVCREMYFRTDQPGAVLILECADVAEAKTVLDTLPFVKAGFIEFDLIPLGAFMPLATLFAKQE